MKPRLQTSLSQHLVMTPQLQQAIRLLQMSAIELEAELVNAVESNPLLDWTETAISSDRNDGAAPDGNGQAADSSLDTPAPPEADWGASDGETWYQRVGPGDPGDEGSAAEQVAEAETLHDHLLWQLHLSPLSPRDRQIAVALIESIDDNGYLRELESIAASLEAELHVGSEEIQTALCQIQRFDPAGVGARDLAECLRLQLEQLPAETPGRELARKLANGALERLPRIGVSGLAHEMKLDETDVDTAVQLLRSLDPRPGAQIGAIATDTYVAPDVVIWRQHGLWRVALSDSMRPRVSIHRGYEGMIRHASASDASVGPSMGAGSRAARDAVRRQYSELGRRLLASHFERLGDRERELGHAARVAARPRVGVLDRFGQLGQHGARLRLGQHNGHLAGLHLTKSKHFYKISNPLAFNMLTQHLTTPRKFKKGAAQLFQLGSACTHQSCKSLPLVSGEAMVAHKASTHRPIRYQSKTCF